MNYYSSVTVVMSAGGNLKRTIDFEIEILELKERLVRSELERKKIIKALLNSGIIKPHHLEALENNQPIFPRPIPKTVLDIDLDDETLQPHWLKGKC